MLRRDADPGLDVTNRIEVMKAFLDAFNRHDALHTGIPNVTIRMTTDGRKGLRRVRVRGLEHQAQGFVLEDRRLARSRTRVVQVDDAGAEGPRLD